MYINFSNHKADKNVSSFDAFNYLDKENQLGIFKENFFSGQMDIMNLENPNNHIDMLEAIKRIDENRGTQTLKSSNFYMMNLSPSEYELEHLAKIAEEELFKKGLDPVKFNNDPDAMLYYNEQKEELVKAQLKLYVKDVMDKYAELMDREIYKYQDLLPDREQRKELKPLINSLYQDFLNDKGIAQYSKSENEFIPLDIREKKEVDKGLIVKIYDSKTNQNISLFLPKNKYIQNTKDELLVDDMYFQDKYSQFILNKDLDNTQISVSALASKISESKSNFTDCQNMNKIKIEYQWNLHDTKLDLYFDASDCNFNEGRYSIKQYDLDQKLQEQKINYLNKKFQDKRQDLFDSYSQKKGWDFSKTLNEMGNEEYLYPDRVPTEEVFKKGNTAVSVDFNNWLVDEGHIEKLNKSVIKDWDATIDIKATVVAESEKAKLLLFEDEKLTESTQKWVGNFAIKEQNEDQTQFTILKDVYDDLVTKEILKNNSPLVHYTDYAEINYNKTKNVRAKESIIFEIYEPVLKENINLQILKEDLLINNGEYTISKLQYDTKYKNALYEHCKVKFENVYEKITNEVSSDLLGRKQSAILKESELRFKNYLNQQGISFERNDRYHLEAKILDQKNNSSQISYKPTEYENEIRFWVNNSSFEKEGKDLFFKNTENIKSLINKAIIRDREQKELVEVPHFKIEYQEKTIKGTEEKERSVMFHKHENGFKDPIIFSIKEKDIVEKEGKFYTTKYNLDNKLEKAINSSISKEYGSVKDNIKHKVWEDFGFNTEKRKITGDDLLYFSKIEHERTYKFSDPKVKFNEKIYSEINKSNNKNEKLKLESQLLKDKYTGEFIKEGNKKGGLNYHIHTIVSRHDKASILAEDKVSMSPTANQKSGEMNNGSKVGFERTELFKAAEKIFDEKFNFNRPTSQTFEYQNTLKNSSKSISMDIAGKLTEELKKHTGVKEIEATLNPIVNIKSQISAIPLPTSLPVSKVDAIKKLVKMVKQVAIDKGIEH
ncbi:hypothetical protein J2O02_18285 (plasmid) [Elizabethkingia anophelis]|uniref:DUF5712 family protein n=1 Tax=Elizabethkingia anophelis TaxID=1117645 RepID=UPI0020B7B76C|nr:DUF5712 family protein [Elizabethkingia anophelis]UTG66815.1 hypothetical protein J2O02_18285 [Elizabethkingia anophelis]